MVTREVSCRHEIDSFKIEVICHIMGNSKLGKTLQLVTISYSKAIDLFCVLLFSKQAQLIVRLVQTKATTINFFLLVNSSL